MTVAGFAVGARQGYIYVRGEYPVATERLSHAFECREQKMLGDDILGVDFSLM